MTRVSCRNPVPGKAPTRIASWKFDLVRTAVLASVPDSPESVEFEALPGLVRSRLTEDERDRLGSLGWYVTTVKLELEVRGEIERVPGRGRQRLRRGPGESRGPAREARGSDGE